MDQEGREGGPEPAASKDKAQPAALSKDEVQAEFQQLVELIGAFGTAATTRNRLLVGQSEAILMGRLQELANHLITRGVDRVPPDEGEAEG